MGILAALKAIPKVSLTLGRNQSRPWSFSHPGPEYGGWVWPESDEYLGAIERADLSSLVTNATSYRANNAASTPWVLRRRDGTETVTDHPVLDLLNFPSEFDDGLSLVIALWKGMDIKGNAFALKVSNGMGRVSELWRRPSSIFTPQVNTMGMLTHYEYKTDGAPPAKYYPKDVVHLRYPNPKGQPWDGLSPLAALGIPLWLDEEAGRFSTAMVKNGANPGFIMSLADMPEEDRPNLEELEAMRLYIRREYSGVGRGKPMLTEFPVNIHKVQMTPEEMQLHGFHDFAEERIAGAYALPAALLQFRAGLQRTTANATLREWRKQAWEESIIPTQDLIAEQLSRQLLPDFMGSEARRWVLGYNRDSVQVLQTDHLRESERWRNMTGGPWATVGEARASQGMEVTDDHDVLWVPQGMVPVRPDDLAEMMRLNYGMMDTGPAMTPTPGGSAAVRSLPRMSRRTRGLVRRMDRDEKRLRNEMARELEAKFQELGRLAGDAFGQQDNAVRQLGPDDEALLSRIIASLDVKVWQQEALLPAFDGHYVRTLNATVRGVNAALGLNVMLPDALHRQIISMGGTRLGLIDLETATRDAVFRALEKGRELGEGADAMARRIRDQVGAGRYTRMEELRPGSGAQYRARMIARTETKFAQNQSTAAVYEEAGIANVILVDDQIGYGDEECAARNGQQVSLAEGREIINAGDHPNGTLRMVASTEGMA